MTLKIQLENAALLLVIMEHCMTHDLEFAVYKTGMCVRRISDIDIQYDEVIAKSDEGDFTDWLIQIADQLFGVSK